LPGLAVSELENHDSLTFGCRSEAARSLCNSSSASVVRSAGLVACSHWRSAPKARPLEGVADPLKLLSLDLLLLLRQCLGAIRRCLRAFGKLRLAHYHYTPTASKRVAPAAVQ
jgi:hypothetical protein